MRAMRTDRRQFVNLATAVTTSAVSARRVLGANERIRIGVIGTGGRGQLLMEVFRRCPEAEVVAVCDVYEPRRDQAREKAGTQARGFGDYRSVLDDQGIDAVIHRVRPVSEPLYAPEAPLMKVSSEVGIAFA
jgi:threonine dehydrogenase-like Zn-dependent dehydrogenase